MRVGPISKTILESRLESWCITKDAPEDEDTEFHESRLACCSLEDTAVNLEALFKNEIIRFTQYAQTAHSTAKLFRAFYEEEENRDRMTSPSQLLEGVRHRLVEKNVHKIADAIDAGIIAPLKRLYVALTPVKEEVRLRCEAKALHDHYRRKLAILRAENEKTLAKGKPLSRREIETLIRDEAKYDRCRVIYIARNKRAITLLKYVYDTRFEYLDQVFSSYADLQRMMWEHLSRDCDAWKDALLQGSNQPFRAAGPMPVLPPVPDVTTFSPPTTDVPSSAHAVQIPEAPARTKPASTKFTHLRDYDDYDDDDVFGTDDKAAKGSIPSRTPVKNQLRTSSSGHTAVGSQDEPEDPEDPFGG